MAYFLNTPLGSKFIVIMNDRALDPASPLDAPAMKMKRKEFLPEELWEILS
jgi:hypothetical protein